MGMLEMEFERRVFDIQASNYVAIINRLKQFVIDTQLSDSDILISNKEALEVAHEAFCRAKKLGLYDELNCKVEND